VDAIRREMRILDDQPRTPAARSGATRLERELIIPFGASGYVALFVEFSASHEVAVSAFRHQREDDYH